MDILKAHFLLVEESVLPKGKTCEKGTSSVWTQVTAGGCGPALHVMSGWECFTVCLCKESHSGLATVLIPGSHPSLPESESSGTRPGQVDAFLAQTLTAPVHFCRILLQASTVLHLRAFSLTCGDSKAKRIPEVDLSWWWKRAGRQCPGLLTQPRAETDLCPCTMSRDPSETGGAARGGRLLQDLGLLGLPPQELVLPGSSLRWITCI